MTQRNFILTAFYADFVEAMQGMKANAHLCFRYAACIEQRQILKFEIGYRCAYSMA
ncbi:hypothetical protein HBJ16_001926 [Pseudomonas sp. CES]|jgi:hypothetical protein|uniref:Uncharacterized protein n=1 Tax=Pseudomonas taiwanensis SJ9 TaxID=1388762 RepID=V7D8D3_9PSED|nr:hypothetical protein O164_23610 [Pseudomonas taiwanensis SJ9]KAF4560468.1 hypothetical protein HBJ16_001926 [Pseudomonas sp. CES]